MEERLPKQWLSRAVAVSHITFDPRNDNVIIMHDNMIICVIDKSKTLPNSDAKIPRLESGDSMDNSNHGLHAQSHGGFHVVKKYKVKRQGLHLILSMMQKKVHSSSVAMCVETSSATSD